MPHTPLPTPFDHDPFTVAAAQRRGVGRGRLRAGDLERPFHGVRATASSTYFDLARAYSTRMPTSQHFSHWTAAQLHGLPLPRLPHELHVTSLSPARTPRVRGVVGHSTSVAAVVAVQGLRVSTPVQAWVDMSTQLEIRDLVVMGDALVRRKNPIASIQLLAEAVLGHRGQRGAAALAAAFARVRAGTDSVKETHLRLAIVDFGLPEPVVNLTIVDARGRFVAFGDLAFPQYRVLAEYDGEQHRTDEKQFHRDVDRLDDLAHIDWRVVRFNKSHITRARLERLRQALLASGWRP